MTVGNFTPFLGTLNDDPLKSFFALDNTDALSGQNLEIVYGLLGQDVLDLSPDVTADAPVILVGGFGGDEYALLNNSDDGEQFAIIFDNGNSESVTPDDSEADVLIAEGLDFGGEDGFLTVDNGRHLYLFAPVTDQYVLLLDWQSPENQIESFLFDFEQELTYQQLVDEVNTQINAPDSNFLGDFTFEELQNSPHIPEEVRFDLESVGLSPATIDDQLQKIADTANDFQDNILFSATSINGSLDNDDKFYIFNDERFFYDLYSLALDDFGSGDGFAIRLTSEDFDPLLFILDSKGNVLQSNNDLIDGNNTAALAFVVGSGEPLFVAVESAQAQEVGDYNLELNVVEADADYLDKVNREQTNIDDLAILSLDPIQVRDSLTGSLTNEDVQFSQGGDTVFFDTIALVGGHVGEQVQITLDSDFVGGFILQAYDANGNNTRENELVEQITFTVEDNLNYVLIVAGSELNASGDYTLTTGIPEVGETPPVFPGFSLPEPQIIAIPTFENLFFP